MTLEKTGGATPVRSGASEVMLGNHVERREGLMSRVRTLMLLATRAAVLVVIGAIAASGCGGSGSSPGSSSGPEYYKQVTAVGNQLATKLERVQSGVSTAPTKSAALTGMRQLAAAFDSAASRLSSLHAPSEASSLHAKAVADLHEAASTLRADVSHGDLDKASSDYSRLGEAAKNAILDITIKGP